MKRVLLVIAILMLALPVWGATLRISENFDDQPSLANLAPLITRAYGVSDIEPPVFSWGAGRGGTGYSFGSGSTSIVWLEYRPYANWYTNELYVSFWMRYPTYNYADDVYTNAKYWYPFFGPGGEDRWEATTSIKNISYMALYDGGSGGPGFYSGGSYITNATDGNWHRYEFYLNFSTGEATFWYDGSETPGFTHTMGSGWTTNYIYQLSFMSASESSDMTRFMDDLEVWDGMPDEESPSTPTIRSGSIVNGGLRP